jgi:hypothetical protein
MTLATLLFALIRDNSLRLLDVVWEFGLIV